LIAGGGFQLFVGHYGVSFVAKSHRQEIPLWLLFIAVQLIDVFWAIFVLFEIEKVRIVPVTPRLVRWISITCPTRTVCLVRHYGRLRSA
jgi:hypothetical protein